jgi:hypothetical protein
MDNLFAVRQSSTNFIASPVMFYSGLLKKLFSALFEFRRERIEILRLVETIDVKDPVLERANVMLMTCLFECLPRADCDRISNIAKWSLLFEFLWLPITLMRQRRQWLLVVLTISVIAAMVPSESWQRKALISTGVGFLYFWREVIFGITRVIFLFLDWMTWGFLMEKLGNGYLAKNVISRSVLKPSGPVFPLLGLYAEALNAGDYATYH